MTTIRIFQPFKSTMQAGKGKSHVWRVTFDSTDSFHPNPLTGLIGARDMRQEVQLCFPSLLKAIEYAKVNGFDYVISTPQKTDVSPKTYEINFTCPRLRGEKRH